MNQIKQAQDALTWLYTHCKAIGMVCKSDSGKWEHDIALFTQQMADELRALRTTSDAPKLIDAALASLDAQPCKVCGETTPYTGSCGSSDPKALCKMDAQPEADFLLALQRIVALPGNAYVADAKLIANHQLHRHNISPTPVDAQPEAEQPKQEPVAPHILEALSYHRFERDDLTLDDAITVIRNGWQTVHGRTERQLVLQVAALLAAHPAAQPCQDKPTFVCCGNLGPHNGPDGLQDMCCGEPIVTSAQPCQEPAQRDTVIASVQEKLKAAGFRPWVGSLQSQPAPEERRKCKQCAATTNADNTEEICPSCTEQPAPGSGLSQPCQSMDPAERDALIVRVGAEVGLLTSSTIMIFARKLLSESRAVRGEAKPAKTGEAG